MSPTSRVSPQDPVAVVVASVIAIVGAVGLWTRWGLTADDVAQLGGAALALAAAWRTIVALRKPAPALVVGIEPAVNPELGPQFIAAVVDEIDRRRVAEDTTRRIEGVTPADG